MTHASETMATTRRALTRLGSAIFAVACMGFQPAALAASEYVPDAGRRTELIRLVRQDCGSCHGITLKGGLGPALLPEALHDKPAVGLKATILRGRPGTAMPPWDRFVNEQEADWIVDNLQKGFPGER